MPIQEGMGEGGSLPALGLGGPYSDGPHGPPLVSLREGRSLSIDFRYDQIPSDRLSLEFPEMEMEHDGNLLYPTGYAYDTLYEELLSLSDGIPPGRTAQVSALSGILLVRFLDEPDSILDFGYGCGYATVREVTVDGLVISVSGAGTKRIRIVRLPK